MEPVVIQVLMVGQLRVHTDHGGDAHVGADVADPVEFDQQIRIGGVGIDVALSRAHALEMVPLQHHDQLADHLDQGLDPASSVHVPLPEGLLRFVQHVHDGALQHRQLRQGRRREHGVVLVQGGGMVRNVHGVVPQTLEFRGDLVILVHDGHMVFILQMGQEADQIPADPVGHLVDLVLVRQELLVQLGIVLLEQPEGPLDVGPGGGEHRQQQMVAALEGQGRRIEEDRVQSVGHVLELSRLFRPVLYDPAAEALDGPHQRQQRQRAEQVEDRVGVGDDAGIGGPVPEPVQQTDLVGNDYAGQRKHRLAEIVDDVYHAHPPGLRLGADPAYDTGGHAVTQVDAHDNRIDGFELQQTGP